MSEGSQNDLSLSGEDGASEKIERRPIEDELRESFLDYSMSVIVQRALPDVRDGLKPVHRRILYAMHELGLVPTRPFKKSATVVGDVLGKYHPHGDSAVYEALVRMVQDFSLRYPLIDGQGNFGSIDGDRAAAYRYTEARLTRLAREVLEDIDKSTVDFTPNFDDQLKEPVVLPSRLPNLLVNGATGIAVGMATNIPPHNLREVVEAAIFLSEHPEATAADLMQIVKGPDFPTGGIIHGRDGIRDAYETGRGKLIVRGRTSIEENDDGRGERIVISDVPYQVNKSRMIEQIVELVRDRKITGISDLRDESDKDGIRVVIELKHDAIPQVVLNQLYKHTLLQTTFAVTNLALVGGVPKELPLRDMLHHFLVHRREVIVRRTQHELVGARDREHVLEGLVRAVDVIDEVIATIRASRTTEEANSALQAKFGFSERQTSAILAMRLSSLTGLQREELEAELNGLRLKIADWEAILASEARQSEVIRAELREITEQYGDERRTDIVDAGADFSIEDLIPDTEVVITVSHAGYIKRMPVETYRTQRRGGRGVTGVETKEEDWIERVYTATAHDRILCFTSDGLTYSLRAWEIPEGGRLSRGKPIVNLVNIKAGTKIAAIVPVREFAEDRFLFFATRSGIVKRTPLSAYRHVRGNGVIAMSVGEKDEVIDVLPIAGADEILLATRGGVSIRFRVGDVRPTGRDTMGVRGIFLKKRDRVVSVISPTSTSTVLVATERGMGKRTAIDAYRLQRRGGNGVLTLRITEKTGRVVSVRAVQDEEELVLITKNGIINRQRVGGVPVIGRNTQGVRLITLDDGDALVDVTHREDEDEVPSDSAADEVFAGEGAEAIVVESEES